VYQWALEGYKKALGPDYISTLNSQQLGHSLCGLGLAKGDGGDISAGAGRQEEGA
jgi:hypothetical protein